VANIASGFIGGMAGCAMIGQSVINVKSGGRGRLSTLSAGVFLLLMVVFLGDWVGQIPMAALVAVMIMVSIGTFNWGSLRDLRTHPKSSSAVMLATVVVTVFTHDLAMGVLTGVLLSGFFFAHKVGRSSMCAHGGGRRPHAHLPHLRPGVLCQRRPLCRRL
jgi:SulP family sulfate permease